MSKSVTVKFADGTSHVYEDVPDDVSDSQVQERAATDYNKPIEAVNPPTAKQISDQNYQNQSLTDRAIGALGAGANLAGQALTSPVGHVLEGGAAVKYLADRLGNRVSGPVAPAQAVQTAQTAINAPQARMPVPNNTIQFNPAQPAPQQPGIMQRGIDYANRMRQAAAQRVVGFGASGAAVPAGVAAGGAAATGIAGGQMAAMTPEQRKAYYDNMMLGAMGGDAGLAAAIMNRGQ